MCQRLTAGFIITLYVNFFFNCRQLCKVLEVKSPQKCSASYCGFERLHSWSDSFLVINQYFPFDIISNIAICADDTAQQTITFSKSIKATLGKGVKYVQNKHKNSRTVFVVLVFLLLTLNFH